MPAAGPWALPEYLLSPIDPLITGERHGENRQEPCGSSGLSTHLMAAEKGQKQKVTFPRALATSEDRLATGPRVVQSFRAFQSLRVPEYRAVDIGVGEIRARKLRPAEVRVRQIGPRQDGPGEIGGRHWRAKGPRR